MPVRGVSHPKLVASSQPVLASPFPHIGKMRMSLVECLADDPYGDAVLAEIGAYEQQGLDPYSFWMKPDLTESIMKTLKNTTVANSDGEYTNVKFSIRPGWVSVPAGFGKTSVGLGMKHIYHENFLGEAFDMKTVFYNLKDKFNFLREHKGEEMERKFFLTDEPTRLQGIDSMALVGDAGNLDQSVRMAGLNDAYIETDSKQYGLPINYILRVKARDMSNGVNICSVHAANGMEIGHAAFEIPPRSVWKEYQVIKREHIRHVKDRAFRSYAEEAKECLNMLDENKGVRQAYRAFIEESISGRKGDVKASKIDASYLKHMLAIHRPDIVGELREAMAVEMLDLLKREYGGDKT